MISKLEQSEELDSVLKFWVPKTLFQKPVLGSTTSDFLNRVLALSPLTASEHMQDMPLLVSNK